jgi:glutaredoxin
MATKDVTVRNINSKVYEAFSVEAQKHGLSLGEAMSQAMQIWLTRRAQIIRVEETPFNEQEYKPREQPVQIELYESSTCPHCPEAKKGIIEAIKHRSPKFVGVSFIDVSKPEGLTKAKELGINSVPTTIIKIRITGAHPLLKEKILNIMNSME